MTHLVDLELCLDSVITIDKHERALCEEAGLGRLCEERLSVVQRSEEEKSLAAHSFREVELDFVVQVFEVQRAVLHAREQAEDEEMTALPTEEVLDGRELFVARSERQ